MMNNLALIAELIIFVLIAFLGLYDWFYTKGLRRTSNHWGIIFPEKIEKLVVLSRKGILVSLVIILILILVTLATP